MFADYLSKLNELLRAIEADKNKCLTPVEQMVEDVVIDIDICKQRDKKLIWIGNGGSAAIASHCALDYFRTGGFKSTCFNDGPLLTCLGNDFGYAAVFEKPLALFADAGDILFAISSSGKSENILRAVDAARKKRCRIVTLSGFAADNPLREKGDMNFYAPAVQYGQVELAHSVLCHSFLDIYMAKQTGQGG